MNYMAIEGDLFITCTTEEHLYQLKVCKHSVCVECVSRILIFFVSSVV